MARNISFSLTTAQFRARTKTVTRRLGWKSLQPGDLLMGCEKCMGLRPGDQIRRLGLIRVVSVRSEQLSAIYMERDGCAAEGFPDMTPAAFVEFFTRHMRAPGDPLVTRIEFEYMEDER